jgi:hypothetical protein
MRRVRRGGGETSTRGPGEVQALGAALPFSKARQEVSVARMCVMHKDRPVVRFHPYCASCLAANRERARFRETQYGVLRAWMPQESRGLRLACLRAHDQQKEAYQCPHCHWWVVPRGDIGPYAC